MNKSEKGLQTFVSLMSILFIEKLLLSFNLFLLFIYQNYTISLQFYKRKIAVTKIAVKPFFIILIKAEHAHIVIYMTFTAQQL